MKRVRCLFATTLALGLIGCSSEEKKQPGLANIALSMAQERLKRKDVETASTTKAPPQVTREQMQALGRPVVFVSVPRFGTGVAAVELAKNGPFRTFMGADQATVTLRDGIITGTRGLLVDLIAQEISIPITTLFRGAEPKTFTKTQRHLTGESTLVTYEYTCAIARLPDPETLEIFEQTHSVHKYAELCRRDGRAFQNDYWVGQTDGVVWKSNQSVSKEVGHVTFQRVVK